jgi:DNA-binding transcriptional regulator GbsR (MarR family)
MAAVKQSTGLHTEEKQFAEEVGVVFERLGLPRMAGRIFGWLLVSDPIQQSPEQISSALLASRGSVSTTTRFLTQLGLIERQGVPGVRHLVFRIRADALQYPILHNFEEETRLFHHLAETGLKSLKNLSPATRQWLEEMRDIHSFLGEQLPLLCKRWEQRYTK